MSDFYLDIQEAIEALMENNIAPVRQLFDTWNLDINSADDWAAVQDHINNFLENK
jgi:hypothetical protein